MPAAAVIPAPIAYIKFAVVKKLVVELRLPQAGPPILGVYWTLWRLHFLVNTSAVYSVGVGTRTFTLNKSECSKQACLPECFSME